MADVVKEVVAEVIGGVMSKAFGIGTARYIQEYKEDTIDVHFSVM